MSYTRENTIYNSTLTLPLKGVKSYLYQVILVSTAVILPVIAHIVNAPVRYLLPMHWAVILAGLVYGWRSGAITGLLAPIISFLISGMPAPHILMPMTFELFTYGFLVGLLREKVRMNAYLSAAIALLAGRIVFVLSILAAVSEAFAFSEYIKTAILPGIPGALLQIIILPNIAKWWIKEGNN